MLKCSLCGTEDQERFTEGRKNRYKGTKEIVSNWCRECLKQKDVERRNKNKLNNDLTRIVKCPKCNCSGNFSSGFFKKSRYLFSKGECLCRNCRKTPQFKIRKNQSKRIRDCLRDHLKLKKKHHYTMKLIGCSPDQLITYLENKLQKGMTWENYGTYWHIDHIKPLAKFDLSKDEEIEKCFHFSNLQPLTAKENLEKGDKL